MNCPNCKKDLVFGVECDNAACIALRPQVSVVQPLDVKRVVKKVKK